jgi:hypothetical protein
LGYSLQQATEDADVMNDKPIDADADQPQPGWGSEMPQSLPGRADRTRQEKIESLRQSELDLCERLVAAQENTPPTEPRARTLDQLLRALAQPGAGPDEHPVPTTHG